MNRKHQLEQTLKNNIENSTSQSEFIIVDFNSNDGLKNYIYSNFKNYIDNKKLYYYYTDQLINWHASIAKNTTHMLANGKYVCNLDCDNFIGENNDEFIIKQFQNDENIILTQTDYIYGSGNAGRITLTKDNFVKLGGYNEQFFPMGYQDIDLIKRGELLNLKKININKNNNTIKNTKSESIKNVGLKLNYNKMDNFNKLLSKIYIDNNIHTVNLFKKNIGLKIL